MGVRTVDNRQIGLICQGAGCILGIVSVIAIVRQNPIVVAGLCIGAGLYFAGVYIKDRL